MSILKVAAAAKYPNSLSTGISPHYTFALQYKGVHVLAQCVDLAQCAAHITHLHCNTRGAVHVLAQCVDLAEQCEAITVSQGRFMPPLQNSSPRKY